MGAQGRSCIKMWKTILVALLANAFPVSAFQEVLKNLAKKIIEANPARRAAQAKVVEGDKPLPRVLAEISRTGRVAVGADGELDESFYQPKVMIDINEEKIDV